MVWPFGKKKAPKPTTTARPQAPRAAGADQALVDEILTWLRTHTDIDPVLQAGETTHVHVGKAATKSDGPAGAVLKVKRGKLSWVDLYDPDLRATVNDLVKVLDKQQKWSFNGVIATKYQEE